MSCSRPSRTVTVWGMVACFSGVWGGLAPVSAQDAAGPLQPWQALTEIPERFGLLQDGGGYFWQVSANGALTSGATDYLPSGLNLLVEGIAFAPGAASRRGDWEAGSSSGSNPELQVKETRDGLAITREWQFDLPRGAVRVVDMIKNTGSQASELAVDLRTTYPVAWQDLFDESGQPFLPTVEAPGPSAIVVDFGASEGRQETLFVLGGLGAKATAEVKASANSRELTFSYRLSVPAGESRGVVHWIMQRPLREAAAAAEVLAFVEEKGRLRTALPAEWSGLIANFGPEAMPEEQTTPAQLKALLALNQLTDQIGQHRRKSDLLWLSASNLLTGSVGGDALELVAPEGSGSDEAVGVPLAEIAALRGGMGLGLPARVYLRNGEVLVGNVATASLQFQTGTESPPIPLNLSDLHLLLFATGSNDGVPPSGATFFVQTPDGAVEAMETLPDLRVHAPWGEEIIAAKDLSEVMGVTSPTPRWRVRTTSGEEYAALAIDFGKAFDSMDRIWRAGASGLLLREREEEWFEFDDVSRPLPSGPAWLLEGNVILTAPLAAGTLDWIVEGTALPVDSTQIISMTRGEDRGGKMGWTVVLADGNTFFGSIKIPYLAMQHGERRIELPVRQVLAFRVR